jgi:hypothetical protein
MTLLARQALQRRLSFYSAYEDTFQVASQMAFFSDEA